MQYERDKITGKQPATREHSKFIGLDLFRAEIISDKSLHRTYPLNLEYFTILLFFQIYWLTL
jgi:hypothetical protein